MKDRTSRKKALASGTAGAFRATTATALLQQLRLVVVLVLAVFFAATTTVGAFGTGNGVYLYKDDPRADGVVEEYTGSSRKLRSRGQPMVVKFYSPYCGHCIHYKPNFLKLSEAVRKELPGVKFAAVSCAAHGDVCRDFDVASYPSVYAFNMGTDGDDGDKDSSRNGVAIREGSKVTAAKVVKAFRSSELAALPPDSGVGELDAFENGGPGLGKQISRNLATRDDDDEDEDEDGDENDDENDSGEGDEDRDSDDEEDDADKGGNVSPDEDNDEEEEDEKEGAGEGEDDDMIPPEKRKGAMDAAGEEDSDDVDVDSDDDEEGGGGAAAADGGEEDSDEDKDDEDGGGDSDEREDSGDEVAATNDSDDEEDSDEDREPETKDSDDDASEDEEDRADEDSDDDDDDDDDEDSDDEDSDDDVAPGKKYKGPKGALIARQAIRDTDRFKDFIAEERNRATGRGHLRRGGVVDEEAAEGATQLMRSHVVGTKEFEQRRKRLIEAIRRHKGKKHAERVERAMEMHQKKIEDIRARGATSPVAKKEVPFRKEVTKPKFVEKLPVMSRLSKMSHEEELILDVTLSFMHGLRVGVFRSNRALSEPQKKALRDWLAYLRISLPQEWALHDLIDDLLENVDFAAKKAQNLEMVMDRHPIPRITWSRSCGAINKIGGGFTCGFWKLLHTSTIGIAEYQGGLNLQRIRTLRKDTSVLSPEAAADVIREYIANFFPCTECSKHFVNRYDDCSYRRCHRLNDKAEEATDADWKELAKYMWEFHNEVSVRLLHEKAAKAQRSGSLAKKSASPPGVDDEIRVLYPTLSECVTCFLEDGSWNEDSVFIFLERTYWPAPAIDSKAARLLTFDNESDPNFNLMLILILFGIGLLYFLRESLFSPDGLQQTMLKAKAMAPKGVVGAQKRSV